MPEGYRTSSLRPSSVFTAGPLASPRLVPEPEREHPLETALTRQPRLVIVSNRVPVAGDMPGGLAVALKDALVGRDALWFGWSGEIAGDTIGEVRLEQRGRTEFAVVDLPQDQFDGYYAGYANRTLWPAFHYRLDISEFSDTDLDHYAAVNAGFAERLSGLLRPDDLIWIHDYHLIPLAAELRKRGVGNQIGFFSHIPFPPPEIFRAIPGHEMLRDGFCANNQVGFQSSQDRANFERYMCDGRIGFWRADGCICVNQNVFSAKSYPIGIDARDFREMSLADDVNHAAEKLGRELAGRRLVLGVDRMDYTKGLVERVKAFEALLDANPELCGKINFVQIAPVSRGSVEAYADLRERLEKAVGHVNGRFATLDWAPIRFIAQPVPRDQVAAIMRLADIALVTPLRDGMNLVAKEYVAAQDDANPGVLVLSRFAGAAEQLGGALIVNPHNPREQMEAMIRALDMPQDERRRRHGLNYKSLVEQDAAWWSRTFLRDLEAAPRQALSSAITRALVGPASA